MNNEFDEEKLDNPLVVHKVTDASYQDVSAEADLNKTHIEEETATLERHRFKKEKKKQQMACYYCFSCCAYCRILLSLFQRHSCKNFK